jgi:hypothetical protein
MVKAPSVVVQPLSYAPDAAWHHHQRHTELVGDVRQRAGSGSAHGQPLHFRLMRDPVWTTWIGSVVVRGIRASLTGATLV